VASFRTLGAHGCFLSHLKILQLAQEQNLDSVLIMEDDLEFIKSFPLIEKQVVSSLKLKNWDLVYFGHILKLDPVKNFRFEPYDKDILQTHFVGFNRQIIPPLITFLKELLLFPLSYFSQPWRIDVDGAYTLFREKYPSTITLVANPSLGYQRSSRGDITPYKWFDQPGILRTCTEKYRVIKRIVKHYFS
jgi:GR25 family glycosyltransferase involved in LPS biosynthesis